MAADKHTLSLSATPFIVSDDDTFMVYGDSALRANPVLLVNDAAGTDAVLGVAQARLERAHSMVYLLSTLDSSETAVTIMEVASAIEPQLDEVKQLLRIVQARLSLAAKADRAPEQGGA